MEPKQQAADLLTAIWQGIPGDYKSKYRMNIWEQFENQVRSAAYTSSLGKFVNSICLKLNASVRPEAGIEEILNSGSDRAMLKLLRDETTLIVLMVRIANQERREEWEKLHTAEIEIS